MRGGGIGRSEEEENGRREEALAKDRKQAVTGRWWWIALAATRPGSGTSPGSAGSRAAGGLWG